MKLVDMTLIDFSKEVESNEPAPGGGSVAAYVSNLGVALARMMANLTVTKKKFKELPENEKNDYMHAFNSLETFYTNLIDMVDKDTEVFNKVMSAYKMPKETEEEVEKRSAAIYKATLEATEMPFEASQMAFEALNILPKLIKNGNKNAISDLASGIYLLEAGMNCSILNVKINAAGLLPEDAKKFTESCAKMQKEARALVEKSMLEINEYL